MSKRLAKKILLIGWDAADWQTINPLIKSGKMPCLAHLIKNGVSGNLATIQPVLSPMLWTSIATGKRADKHGIHGFVEPTPDGSNIRSSSSESRKCKALWNILSQNNLRSNIIGWYASHPAEAINGTMVSNLFSEPKTDKQNSNGLPEGTVYPKSIEKEIASLYFSAKEITAADIKPFIPLLKKIDLTKDNRPQKLAELLASASTIQAVTTQLMEEQEWDFTAVYFPTIDHCGHLFMHYNPPKMENVSQADFELYRYVMEGCYRFHDMMLGTLLKQAGKETTVMIVSDHGYYSGSQRPNPETALTDPESWHRSMGIACLYGPGIKKKDKLYGATLLDITPTILNLFGLPAAMDMDGRSWLETFSEPQQIDPIFSWEMKDNETFQQKKAPSVDPETALSALQQLVDLGYISPLSEDTEKRVRNTIRTNKINLVRALMDSLRIDKAIPILETLKKDYPEEQSYSFALVQCHNRLNNLEKAQALLDQMPAAEKESSLALLLNAEIALKQKKDQKALAQLDKVKAIDPNHPQLGHKQGEIYFALNRLEEAEKAFKRILKKNPDDAFAHNGRARIFIQRKQYDEAIESALEAVGLLHFFPEAHYYLGVALASSKREEDAIAAFTTCEKITGGQFNAVHLWLAKLYKSNNRNPDKAKEYLYKVKGTQRKPSFFFVDKDKK